MNNIVPQVSKMSEGLFLSEVKAGESVYLTVINGSGAFKKRMQDMGFVKGRKITVIKNAPFNDPVEFSLMGYNVSLRRSEASLIEVNPERHRNRSAVMQLTEVVAADYAPVKGESSLHIAIVGNPNSGKTSVFNHASRSREKVANYSGVTVDSKTASVAFRDHKLQITDLPGIYSFSIYSPEELYTRDFILDRKPDVIINIVDAANLERNLYLTTQLIDMHVTVVVALNMFDELRKSGDAFDYRALGAMLGIPFIPTVGSRGKGISRLLLTALEMGRKAETSSRKVRIHYGEEVEISLSLVTALIEKDYLPDVSPRFLAIGLLEGDRHVERYLSRHPDLGEVLAVAASESERIRQLYGEPVESVMADMRYGFIYGALKETYQEGLKDKRKVTSSIDHWLTHRIWGFPIFLLFIWMMFAGTFILGDYPKGWIEQGVGLLTRSMEGILAEGSFKQLLVDGIINGVGSVIVFLPNILILFFFISVMEDTGYMARAVFLTDKIMHRMGLHGKSFIPLIMGFGCNVPAIMATRSIENRKNRLVTMLINPFMSCSARLPVYILLIGAVFPAHMGSILFVIYLFGIVMAVIIALIFKKTFFSGEEAPFVMELPPYRIPTASSSFRHMWQKGSQYLKKMGGVILIGSILIWALGHYPVRVDYERDYEIERAGIEARYDAMITDASGTGNGEDVPTLLAERDHALHQLDLSRVSEHQAKSYIGQVGRFIEPAIRPLGFDWKMGVCLLSGIVAKETIVSTIGILYQPESVSGEDELLQQRIRNMQYADGERIGTRVFSPLATLSFVAFILLYFPCIATITAIGKESGSWKWGAFAVLYTTGLAWLVSFIIYQTGVLIG